MKSFFKTSYNLIRQYKLGIFKLLLNRLLGDKVYYQTYLIYSYDLQKELPENTPAGQAVDIRRVRHVEDELFGKFQEQFPAPAFAARLTKETETLYVAIKNGEVVAYAWITEEALFVDEINYRYPLDSDEIYLYACFVSEAHRGEGIHTMLLYDRLKDYRNRGYTRAYTAVIANNIGSIKGIKKAGFIKLTFVRYLKVLSKEEWWGLTPGRSFKPVQTSDATNAGSPAAGR